MSELKKQNVPVQKNRTGHGEGPFVKTQRSKSDVSRGTLDEEFVEGDGPTDDE